MNRMRILFVIHKLDAGGAQKSLVSLLNSLPLKDYDVDLMAIEPKGIFREQIPAQVHFVDAPNELVCQSAKIKTRRFWQNATLKLFSLKLWTIIRNHLRGGKSKAEMSHGQFYNEMWRYTTPDFPKTYDLAISYLDSMNYYVIDHVKAQRKILWCHNDYNKLEYKASYDANYYDKADKVCTISELCKHSLEENFPQFKDKFEVVENISSARLINAQANMLDEMQNSGDGFCQDKRLKLVSIGRLTEQKGFDFAIDAAKILKAKGLDFCWYVLGEGELRRPLEQQMQANGVADCVRLIGIRSNPYPYIKQADIYVMPSRYEGKSIALDEAKILCKPIVVTNYPSVNDAIESGKNGVVVEITAQAIAAGIMTLYADKDLREKLVSNLQAEENSNERQVVSKFLWLID